MKPSDSFGVAVIGCGWAGRRHAEAFIAEGATLRWAVDSNLDRANQVAQLGKDARAAMGLEPVLADPAVDAVDVCLPHHLHAEAGIATIQARKHLLCEKPLALNLPDADRLTDAAAKAGTVLMVAENECFNPVYLTVQQLLEEGTIGEPGLIQATRQCYLRESFVSERPWFLRREDSGGGILLSGGIHDFAKLRMMLGEITLVHCLRARQRFVELETEDTVVMVLGFANGAAGTLVESFFMLDPVTATGDEVHSLRIDGDSGSLEIVRRDQLRVTTSEGTRHVSVPVKDTFREEVREFMDSVRAGREPKTSARSQRRNLALVEAAYASMASGQSVRL